MRTFVFISDIPAFLLEPIIKGDKDSSGAAAVAASKFDLRYERLRRLLVEHSSGVMLVMHLESKGYALALYASEGEALAACKADITPEQPGRKYPPLRLRIIEKEKPCPPEPVYKPFLMVENEEVRKEELADTRGLELVYRGRAVAKWCARTLAGEDCFFGVSCLKLHKAAVQRTVRKRPRIEDDEAGARLTCEQEAVVRHLLSSAEAARAALTPASMAMKDCTYVPVSAEEMGLLSQLACEALSSAPLPAFETLEAHPTYQAVLQRIDDALQAQRAAAVAGESMTFFPRLSCPGGAPWDWSVESEDGRRLLRQRCPLPANGAPTPLERDVYTQRLWYHMNQLNRCHSARDVLRMLCGSHRAREALRRHSEAIDGGDARTHASSSSLPSSSPATKAAGLTICLQPWLYLPTVGCEVTAYLERGGRRVRGVVQRYGQVRLMTSATLLASASAVVGDAAHVDALLARYAVLESATDAAAEEDLTGELRALQRSFASAVGDVAHHLQTHPDSIGGDGAAWCVHLAAVLTPSVAPAAGPPPPVTLLSASPYQRALEECSMYSSLAPPIRGDDMAASAATAPAKVDVTWNTQRHPYISLFSRSVLEKLRADAA
ncbi:conserved hypothetical protein [Leishmania major strain Friedlin]|uniref:Uncharacterized protein n=1 Tax=Leishmania major TaxID=5664 RepID=Q4Q9X1_LEIMA|nr:conserved hypothetical protein [Leishmania major strain Friedlin]CAG9575139.1 hypothetical_protein_-_conserved [Leishmania major strain Friedlin]CAJ05197.1 conserved hypothetical protein [Leishmania major strain Friedlin]|eukprot:XP_001683877.1 conserved hypothetical protein [Leishmania major strain Friedlin]